MADILEIPKLDDANLMELTVCGQLDTKSPSVKEKLKRIRKGIVARIGTKKSDRYLQVFGGGGPSNSHLHVDVLIRSPEWAAKRTLSPLVDAQAAVMRFSGIPVDATIEGEFFADTTDLPKRGIIRSAMGTAKHGGLTVRQTAQSLAFSDSPLQKLQWEEIASGIVAIGIVARIFTQINPEYLLDGEDFVIRAFNALIIGGRSNVTNRH